MTMEDPEKQGSLHGSGKRFLHEQEAPVTITASALIEATELSDAS